MKLSATIANTNTITQSLAKDLEDRNTSATPAKTMWQSIATRFWALTEESGKASTKSFEGLL